MCPQGENPPGGWVGGKKLPCFLSYPLKLKDVVRQQVLSEDILREVVFDIPPDRVHVVGSVLPVVELYDK